MSRSVRIHLPWTSCLSVGRVSTTLTVTGSAGKATASRLPVPDDDIPAQVSSIPQELMRQQGTNTVADALKNASGVQAVRWYGAYEQYTIRGFFDPDMFDDFNVMLVDGMRLGGNRHGHTDQQHSEHRGVEGPQFHPLREGRGRAAPSISSGRSRKPCEPTMSAIAAAGSTRTRCRGRSAPDRSAQPRSFSIVWTPASKAAMAGATPERIG